MCVHCTKGKKENRQKNQQIQLKFDHTAYQFIFVVSKRRKFRLGKMYQLLGIIRSKLRTYGKGNHFNYLGDDHLILRGRGSWQILTGQNIYLQFIAGQKLYFRLLQDRLFISGYNNVESGGQARLYFYFLGHTGQIIYFQVFGGQNTVFISKNFQPPRPESNGRPLSTYCAKREHYLRGHTKLISMARGGSMD
jgi:hypothetical protein